MRVSIDPGDDRPIYVQIMDEVRRAVVVGTLGPNDPLPSVRELASELRVNPRTVSKAYGELERDSIVFTRRGRGTFVSPDVQPAGRERRAVARKVARRALTEAHRNGIGLDELVEALRACAETPVPVDDAPPATEAPASSAGARAFDAEVPDEADDFVEEKTTE